MTAWPRTFAIALLAATTVAADPAECTLAETLACEAELPGDSTGPGPADEAPAPVPATVWRTSLVREDCAGGDPGDATWAVALYETDTGMLVVDQPGRVYITPAGRELRVRVGGLVATTYCAPPAVSWDAVRAAIERRLPRPVPALVPPTSGLTGLATSVGEPGGTVSVDLGLTDAATGQVVRVVATATAVRWRWDVDGDGQVDVIRGPRRDGRPPRIRHTYTQRGTYAITVSVDWDGEWRIVGRPATDFADPVRRSTTVLYPVAEARAALVG